MMILAIVALVVGILALALMIGYGVLKIYANRLVKSGKWLDTNRSEWIEWLLINLT